MQPASSTYLLVKTDNQSKWIIIHEGGRSPDSHFPGNNSASSLISWDLRKIITCMLELKTSICFRDQAGKHDWDWQQTMKHVKVIAGHKWTGLPCRVLLPRSSPAPRGGCHTWTGHTTAETSRTLQFNYHLQAVQLYQYSLAVTTLNLFWHLTNKTMQVTGYKNNQSVHSDLHMYANQHEEIGISC